MLIYKMGLVGRVSGLLFNTRSTPVKEGHLFPARIKHSIFVTYFIEKFSYFEVAQERRTSASKLFRSYHMI